MSDYLTHLAARSLNVIDAIQPRVASLFEPQPAADAIAVASSAEEGARSRVEQFPRARARIAAAAPLPQARESPTAAPGSTPASVAQPRGGDAGNLLPTQRPFVSATARTTQEPAATGLPVALIARSLPKAPESSPSQESPTVADKADEVAQAERGAESKKSEQISADKAMTVTPNRITRFIEPAASIPEKDTPAPSIRVTIGRVEVRAIMPAPPIAHPPRRQTVPTLSLNDYLQQRDGRRR